MQESRPEPAVYAVLLLLYSLAALGGCQMRIAEKSQSPPPDLLIEGLAGGVDPWRENHSIRISADGRGTYTRYVPREVGAPPLEQDDLELTREALAEVWEAIEQNAFFSLAESHNDPGIRGGSFASLTITANGRTHRVRVQNVSLPRFEAVLEAINRASPPGSRLVYTAPEDLP